MFERIVDIECNRCAGTFQSNEEDTLAVLYNHCYFSICPRCTEEVAALMGFSKEALVKKMLALKEAETENNKKRHREDGTVCARCDLEFAEGEPRIRKSTASNVESWHMDCYQD